MKTPANGRQGRFFPPAAVRFQERCMKRVLWTLAVLIAATPTSFAAGEPPAAVRELIANHCVDCHGPTVHKANLRLDQLSGDVSDPVTFRTWVKVHDRVKAGEMPPRTKLDAKQSAPALKALAEPLAAADRKRQD